MLARRQQDAQISAIDFSSGQDAQISVIDFASGDLIHTTNQDLVTSPNDPDCNSAELVFLASQLY